MPHDNAPPLDLEALERRIEDLVRALANATTENQALRSQRATLVAERAQLMEKTELARARVEFMIARLKAMEIRP
ncbi:MAG: TIGR02449 family protein [Gammaproteobacteria bacterium]